MNEYAQTFDKGKGRQRTKETRQFERKKDCLIQKLEKEKEKDVRKQLLKTIREIEKERIQYPYGDAMDANWRRLKYVRYADDFLVGVIGNKAECVQIKADIAQYMNERLNLELSENKTLTTNAQKPAKFLGYDISIRKSNTTKRDKAGKKVRTFNNRTVLSVTTEVMKKKLMNYDAIRFDYSSGTEVWKPKARGYMKNNEMADIVSNYNAEIRGFYNYYSIANNSFAINSFYNIMEYSMYKTFACKQESSVKKVCSKYMKNKKFSVPFTDSKGQTKYRTFYDEGFKRKAAKRDASCDIVPNTIFCKYPSLIQRLKEKTCELCGVKDDTTMFQVRSLRTLKGNSEWEQRMIKMRRKTLAVCFECNDKIHNER